MSRQERGALVTLLIFGSLRHQMDDMGLPYQLNRPIPPEGCTAHELARQIPLPPEKIEAVFCNGRVINIYDPVFPGDRVAFAPFGTPGPYRVFLGMHRENQERSRREGKGC